MNEAAETCPDTDALLNVSSALGWQAGRRIDHIAACERCQEAIVALDQVHAVLAEEVATGPEYIQAVLSSISSGRRLSPPAMPPAPAAWERWAARVAIFILASSAALGMLLLATTVGGVGPAPLGLNLGTAALAGALILWQSRTPPADTRPMHRPA